jgi:hypothetical protein
MPDPTRGIILDTLGSLKRHPWVKRHDQGVGHKRAWALQITPYRLHVSKDLGALVAAKRALVFAMYARNRRNLTEALTVDGERIQPSLGALAYLKGGCSHDL